MSFKKRYWIPLTGGWAPEVDQPSTMLRGRKSRLAPNFSLLTTSLQFASSISTVATECYVCLFDGQPLGIYYSPVDAWRPRPNSSSR
jgi:hypothetical protein